jgi:hypothetical protein
MSSKILYLALISFSLRQTTEEVLLGQAKLIRLGKSLSSGVGRNEPDGGRTQERKVLYTRKACWHYGSPTGRSNTISFLAGTEYA